MKSRVYQVRLVTSAPALAATDSALMQLLVGLFASLGSFLFGSVQCPTTFHRQRSSLAATISASLADRSPPLHLSQRSITRRQMKRKSDILSTCPSTAADQIHALFQRCRGVCFHWRRLLWRCRCRRHHQPSGSPPNHRPGRFDLLPRRRLTDFCAKPGIPLRRPGHRWPRCRRARHDYPSLPSRNCPSRDPWSIDGLATIDDRPRGNDCRYVWRAASPLLPRFQAD